MADPDNRPGSASDDAGPGAEPRPAPGMPRWVKISWIVVAVLVLLFLVLLLSGQGHGPSRHMGPSNHGAGPAPAAATSDTGGHALTGGGRR